MTNSAAQVRSDGDSHPTGGRGTGRKGSVSLPLALMEWIPSARCPAWSSM